VLISAILNFQTARFTTGNDLPYPLFLPTYAATAWYHKAIERKGTLEAFLKRVRDFAGREYTLALMEGDALDETRKSALAEQLSAMTGLSRTYWLQSNLRVPIFRFVKELRRRQGLTVGRLDTRYVGRDRDSAGESFEFDPSYAAIQAPYTEAVNAYLRQSLGLKEEREYQILSFDVNRSWRWKDSADGGYVNVAEDLRAAMTKNPHLQVLVAAGYYDLATPFYAAEYTMDHLSLPPDLRDNIRFEYFPAGHMMYLHKPSLKKLSQDIRTFVRRAIPEARK
jgi:carboxypeptidase C (cathepsin A)